MSKLVIRILVLAVLLFMGTAVIMAKDNDGAISFSGNYTKATMKQGVEEIALSGGARVETGSVTIEADSIDIYGENQRFLTCSGDVHLVDSEKEIRLVSNVLYYDRETSSLTINGWVEYFDFKNEMIAKGAFLKNDQESGMILIQINVSILKAADENGEMYSKADSALYDSENNILELTGSAKVDYDGSIYQASRILIDLDTNDITMEGDVSGDVQNVQ